MKFKIIKQIFCRFRFLTMDIGTVAGKSQCSWFLTRLMKQFDIQMLWNAQPRVAIQGVKMNCAPQKRFPCYPLKARRYIFWNNEQDQTHQVGWKWLLLLFEGFLNQFHQLVIHQLFLSFLGDLGKPTKKNWIMNCFFRNYNFNI